MKLLLLACIFTMSASVALGVRCFVGAGNSVSVIDCGTSSNKCIKSQVGDLIGKVCFSQMDWSQFPGFDTSVGCQRSSAAGIYTEICICEGDECNGSVKACASTMLALLVTVVTGYLAM